MGPSKKLFSKVRIGRLGDCKDVFQVYFVTKLLIGGWRINKERAELLHASRCSVYAASTPLRHSRPLSLPPSALTFSSSERRSASRYAVLPDGRTSTQSGEGEEREESATDTLFETAVGQPRGGLAQPAPSLGGERNWKYSSSSSRIGGRFKVN